MSDPVEPAVQGDSGRQVSRRRPALMWLLIVLLAAEFLAMVVLCLVVLVGLFTTHLDSVSAGIAVLVLGLVATVWLGFIVVAALRGNAWMRGASIVWQVLMFAVGVGSFQGLTATPAVGWALVVPAVAVVVLLVSPSVVAATARRD